MIPFLLGLAFKFSQSADHLSVVLGKKKELVSVIATLWDKECCGSHVVVITFMRNNVNIRVTVMRVIYLNFNDLRMVFTEVIH